MVALKSWPWSQEAQANKDSVTEQFAALQDQKNAINAVQIPLIEELDIFRKQIDEHGGRRAAIQVRSNLQI